MAFTLIMVVQMAKILFQQGLTAPAHVTASAAVAGAPHPARWRKAAHEARHHYVYVSTCTTYTESDDVASSQRVNRFAYVSLVVVVAVISFDVLLACAERTNTVTKRSMLQMKKVFAIDAG
jgi:hypothetical protein